MFIVYSFWLNKLHYYFLRSYFVVILFQIHLVSLFAWSGSDITSNHKYWNNKNIFHQASVKEKLRHCSDSLKHGFHVLVHIFQTVDKSTEIFFNEHITLKHVINIIDRNSFYKRIWQKSYKAHDQKLIFMLMFLVNGISILIGPSFWNYFFSKLLV